MEHREDLAKLLLNGLAPRERQHVIDMMNRTASDQAASRRGRRPGSSSRSPNR